MRTLIHVLLLPMIITFCIGGCGTHKQEERDEKTKQQQLAYEQYVEEGIANTKQGENLIEFLTRVSKKTEMEDDNNWSFLLAGPHIPTTYNLLYNSTSDNLLYRLELKELELNKPELKGSLLLNIPQSFSQYAEFWPYFLSSEVFIADLVKIDQRLKYFLESNCRGPMLSVRSSWKYLRQNGETYAVCNDGIDYAMSNDQHYNDRGKIYKARVEFYRVYVHKYSSEVLKWYSVALEKAFKSKNEKYAAVIRKGYGDPIQMRSILNLLLKAKAGGAEDIVNGVISSTLKGNGWCESVVSARTGYVNAPIELFGRATTISKPVTGNLMIRTQIAPDGTPRFLEVFQL
ncbi:MAG: hypothetical protein FWG62_03295 [Proteobacteria bacterium]|nr:hypothetical protein [Pseudomonadota bacterium]